MLNSYTTYLLTTTGGDLTRHNPLVK